MRWMRRARSVNSVMVAFFPRPHLDMGPRHADLSGDQCQPSLYVHVRFSSRPKPKVPTSERGGDGEDGSG